jgi:hypothetical protein
MKNLDHVHQNEKYAHGGEIKYKKKALLFYATVSIGLTLTEFHESIYLYTFYYMSIYIFPFMVINKIPRFAIFRFPSSSLFK